MQYSVCKIGSRQYLVKPGTVFEVDKLKVEDKFSSTQVLLMVDGDKVEIGEPFLKTTLDFEVLGNVRKPKIRVARYKSKANYRRVSGHRAEMTKLILADSKKSVKKDENLT